MGPFFVYINYPDELSPYPSRLWWKALAEALDPWVAKLNGLPDKLGLTDLLAKKIDKPVGPRTGQVLTFNGENWIAWDSAAGSGTGGTGGSVLPISQKGSFLVGTGTDWIVLPGGKATGPAATPVAGGSTYTVKSGDSLSNISTASRPLPLVNGE